MIAVLKFCTFDLIKEKSDQTSSIFIMGVPEANYSAFIKYHYDFKRSTIIF